MEGQNTIGKVIFENKMKAVLYLLSVVVIAAAVADGFTKQCGRCDGQDIVMAEYKVIVVIL